MTEEEARSKAIKETAYCYVLACVWEGRPRDSDCLERIFIKGGREEIRLASWKNGKQAMRPADINSPDWLALFRQAINQGVFSVDEQFGMLQALTQ